MRRFKFGDNRQLCDDLTALVLAGKKTGTCWPLRDTDHGEPMLTVGERSIYTDWDGNDVCMVEYTAVRIFPFNAVPESFALSEGENETRDGWARDHRIYFERNGGWSEDMEMVCENFRLVEVFQRP